MAAGRNSSSARTPTRSRSSGPFEAHEIVLEEARGFAEEASDGGDEGANDLLVSDVVRTNEIQVWFVSEHVVDLPLAKAD